MPSKITSVDVYTEHLSLTFSLPASASPTSSNIPSSYPIFSQRLVGAQAALDAILSKANSIQEILASQEIPQQDYYVQAGFNEDLVLAGGGHLEEIYIYLRNSIGNEQIPALLLALGSCLAPFPCVLFTSEESYPTPLPSNSPLGFDSVILGRAERSHQFPILK